MGCAGGELDQYVAKGVFGHASRREPVPFFLTFPSLSLQVSPEHPKVRFMPRN